MRPDIAQVIKETVNCRDYIESCGVAFNARGFACCPFHGETQPSLKVYDRTNSWVCFGCHRGGDVINFARTFYNVGFRDACRLVAGYAGIDTGESGEPDEETAYAQREKAAVAKAKRIAAQQRRERLENQYWEAYDKWLDNERIIQDKAPKSPDDVIDELWANAIIRREILAVDLEFAEARLNSKYGVQ